MSLRLSACLLLGIALLPLPGPAGEPQEPTVITSESLEMRGSDTETLSVFDGRVVVTATGMRLECDHLEVLSTRIGDKADTVGEQDRFKSLVATGNVRIVQGEREARCGRAEVLPREDRITLTEKPVVVDHGTATTFTGDKIYLLRNQRQVRGENVRITAPPLRDLGFDPKETPPAPEGQPKQGPQ